MQSPSPATQTTTGRRLGRRALATTLGLLVAVALLELPAALRWIHWSLLFRTLFNEGFDYQTMYVLDEELLFRRIPNRRWSGRPPSDIEDAYGLPRTLDRTLTFTYDRWGYRNAAEMPQADVVVLGDSYAEGWYVSDEETAASRLGRRLGRPVANLGVAGYGTLQALRVLKGDALARQPNAIVWLFFEGNDLYDDQTFENALAAGPPPGEDTVPRADGLTRDHGWDRRSFVLNAFARIRRWVHPLAPNHAPFWAHFEHPGGGVEPVYFFDYASVKWSDYEEQRWTVARRAFEEGVAVARARGIDIVFVYIPIKFRVFRDRIRLPEGSPMTGWSAWTRLPLRFQEFCAASGVPCLDLTGRFTRALGEGRLPYPLNDTHWTPEGHAIAAAAIEEVLSASRGR